jgi:hypothetical protein
MNAYLSGRCSSGFQADQGRLIHAVHNGAWGKALCGAEPGRLSAYGFIETSAPVTCGRCLKREGGAK